MDKTLNPKLSLSSDRVNENSVILQTILNIQPEIIC